MKYYGKVSGKGQITLPADIRKELGIKPDALCATYARRADDSTVISFDRDFRNIPGVTWEQP